MANTTRLTWKKETEPLRFISAQNFIGNEGKVFKLLIEANTNTLHLMEIYNGFLTSNCSIQMNNLDQCKRRAKALLKKHGVNFFDEVRKKKAKPE